MSDDRPATDELTRRSLAGVLWMASGRGAHAVVQLVVLVVLARLLGPEEFGVLSAALVVIGFSSIFADLGIGPVVIQRPEVERRHLDTAFTASVVGGVAFGLLVAGTAPLIADFFRVRQLEPVLRLLALVFPIQGLVVVAEALVRRELRFRWLAGLDVTAYVVGYGVVALVLAYAGFGAWSLAIAELTRVCARAGILLTQSWGRASLGWNGRAFHELMYFGGGFTIARVANYLALQGDNLVVGRALGPAALGVYTRAYQLMTAPASALGSVLDAVLFPTMAKVQHDRSRLAAAYRGSVVLLTIMMLPLSVVLVVLAPEVIAIALGPQWGAAVLPFQLLTVGLLFRTSYKMSDSLTRATGVVYQRAWRQIVYAIMVVGGASVGQRWGVAGVAMAVVVALAVNFTLMAQLSLRVTGLTWGTFLRCHLPPMALAAACGPIVWAVATLGRDFRLPPPLLLASSIVATMAWVALLARLAPRCFLGRDVLGMLAALPSYLPAPWKARSATSTRPSPGTP